MASPFPYAGELSATASSLLWAVAGVLFVRVKPGVSGIALNLGKNATALACFALLLLLLQGHPWPTGLGLEAWLLLVASGIVGLTLCDSLLFRAFLEIGPRRANVAMAIAPVVVAFSAMLPPLSEHPPPAIWIGIGVSLAGVLLALLERSPDPVRRRAWRRGMRDAALAALLQALGLLLARRGFQVAESADVGTAGVAGVRLAAGTIGLVVLGLVTGRLRVWTGELAGWRTWRRVAAAAFLGTFLGIWTNQAGLAWAEHTGVAATLNGLAPVFLIPLSAAFLGERHDARAWISTALAVGGIALMTLV